MQYLIQRLLSAIPVVLGISIIVFLIISLIPGDPATAILGSFATPDNVAKLNKDLGLDQGLVERYFIWLGNLMQGDFGRSYALNRPVIDEILERFNATLILSGTAFVLCSLFGIIIGTISAAKQYTFTDKIITLFVLIGISVPSFFLGMMMILLFAVNLKWLPVSGMYKVWGGGDFPDLISHLIMPSIALALVATGVIARIARNAVLEILRQDFIRTARAKGLPKHKIIFLHALKPTLLPVISYLGPAFVGMITGSVVIDMYFSTGGIGLHFVRGALNRDYSTIMGITILVGVLTISFNLIVDIL